MLGFRWRLGGSNATNHEDATKLYVIGKVFSCTDVRDVERLNADFFNASATSFSTVQVDGPALECFFSLDMAKGKLEAYPVSTYAIFELNVSTGFLNKNNKIDLSNVSGNNITRVIFDPNSLFATLGKITEADNPNNSITAINGQSSKNPLSRLTDIQRPATAAATVPKKSFF